MQLAEQFRRYRRKRVKKAGKFLLHSLSNFIGRQSLIGDQPVFDKSVFPWTADFEANWEKVRAELDEVLKTRDQLPSFHDISPDQKRISKGDNWKTFIFYGMGIRVDRNCALCPETARLLGGVPNLRNAWFSILSPHYRIPPHQGPTKGIVRIHLGLKIPEDRENCWIRVHDQILHWEEGKCVVFDDFFEHEVQNNTNQQRVVLFFDVDRPLRPLGWLVNRLLIAGIKQTAYVKDAKKNIREWERKTETTEKAA